MKKKLYILILTLIFTKNIFGMENKKQKPQIKNIFGMKDKKQKQQILYLKLVELKHGKTLIGPYFQSFKKNPNNFEYLSCLKDKPCYFYIEKGAIIPCSVDIEGSYKLGNIIGRADIGIITIKDIGNNPNILFKHDNGRIKISLESLHSTKSLNE
jgi:hypothetical protein